MNEEVRFLHSAGEVVLYNSWRRFSEQEILEVQRSIAEFLRLDREGRFAGVYAILVMEEDVPNRHFGGLMNGRTPAGKHMTELYPVAFVDAPHRIPAVSRLEGTLLHEFTHTLVEESSPILARWKQKFSWRFDVYSRRRYPSGNPWVWETNRPEDCVSDYATFHPMEDFCESMVAFLRQPELLSAVKRAFLAEEFPGRQEGQLPEVIQLRVLAHTA